MLTDGQSPDQQNGLNTFPREHRLLTSTDFKQVFDQVTVRAGTGELFFLASFSSSQTGPRLGFIIARKQVKKAVDRNRIKRIVREEFRHLESAYPQLDIIVMAKKGAHDLDRQTLHQATRYLFRKLKKRHSAQ